MSFSSRVCSFVVVGCALVATRASAQTYAPAPPPPTYAPAPTTQPPPPTYYAPPPGYAPQPAYAGPVRMDYEEGGPIPPGYHVVTRTRRGLIVGGAVSFGVLYGLSVVIADSTSSDSYDHERLKYLYIPAIGPFISASKVDSGTGTLILDGLGQTAGLVMFICGFAVPKTELVRNDVAEVHVAPLVGRGASGLALVGAF